MCLTNSVCTVTTPTIVHLIPGHQDHNGGSFAECFGSKSLPYPTASSRDLGNKSIP